MADTIVVPENAAHGCPGANTESAGKTSACEGCPNKGICSEGKTVDTGKDAVIERLKSVKRKLLVLSGKGGVGKSTITMLLAKYLSDKFKSLNFGVLDLDICGPSQPRMMGVENEQVHSSGSGWSPVNIDDNLCLMSIGFLLSSPDDAIIWRGPKKNNMIRQFLSNVDWGKLDLLLLDTPPGTSDEHMSSFSYLNTDSGDTGVLIVTTPHEIALLDVRKQISFCRKFNIPIVGVIENMSLFHCGKCGNTSNIFSTGAGAVKEMCEEFNLKFLGSLPIDTRLAELCDKGFDEFALSEATIKSLDVMSVEVEKFWT